MLISMFYYLFLEKTKQKESIDHFGSSKVNDLLISEKTSTLA